MSREIMEHFIKSCEKEAKRQLDMDTQWQGDVQVTGGHVGALDLIEDQGEGNNYQPLLTSTPKQNSEDPLAPLVTRDTSGREGVSGNGPLPNEGTPAWGIGDGPEEIAELCLPEVESCQVDDVPSDDQDQETRSVAGDLVEEDVLASEQLSSNNEGMCSLDEVVSSLNWVMDSSVENTESIKKLLDTYRKQCVKVNRKLLKVTDENISLRNDLEAMKMNYAALTANFVELSQRVKALEADKKGV